MRTFDALHLAVAAGAELPLVTADRQQAAAGRAAGVEVLFLSEEEAAEGVVHEV